MRVDADSSQLRKLAADLEAERAAVVPRVSKVVQAYAQKTWAGQRTMVRQRSGRTHDSITWEMLGPLEADIGPTWFVARFLEYGGAHNPPWPFVGPAWDRLDKAYYADLADAAGRF